jgi:membrane-associated protein
VLTRVESSDSWRRAQETFDRRGGLAILITRFLLTPLAIPINLIAGSSRYAFWRFLTFDLLGELIWVALYGGLGYLFADSWEAISDLAGSVSGLLVGIVVLGVAGYLAYRHWGNRSYA